MQTDNFILTQQDVADKLLWGLWRSIDESYKKKYLSETWDHLENVVRSASRQNNSLKKVLSEIKSHLPINIQAQYQKDILSVIDSGQEEEILNWLRTETNYLVMLVRVANQERQEAYKERMQ